VRVCDEFYQHTGSVAVYLTMLLAVTNAVVDH